MDQDKLIFNPNLLFILQGFTIYGETRIQKYAFQIFQNYKNELKQFDFYSDWIPYYYGPYSPSLNQDLWNAKKLNFIKYNDEKKSFSLKMKGEQEYRKHIEKHNDIFNDLHELIFNLQKKRLVVILKDIYSAYPYFTTKSKIKDQLDLY